MTATGSGTTATETALMTRLPKRVPAAGLPPRGVAAPHGGWFGTDVQWPIADPDAVALAAAAAPYLHTSELPDRPDTEDILHRVLIGLHHLNPDHPSPVMESGQRHEHHA